MLGTGVRIWPKCRILASAPPQPGCPWAPMPSASHLPSQASMPSTLGWHFPIQCRGPVWPPQVGTHPRANSTDSEINVNSSHNWIALFSVQHSPPRARPPCYSSCFPLLKTFSASRKLAQQGRGAGPESFALICWPSTCRELYVQLGGAFPNNIAYMQSTPPSRLAAWVSPGRVAN